MNVDNRKFKSLFDFDSKKSNILIYQSSAEVCINGRTYKGNGKVYLTLTSNPHIYLMGYFNNVDAIDATRISLKEKEITYFSINNHQIKGFHISSDYKPNSREFTIGWRPNHEPIIGVGDESTQIKSVTFHLFNFTDLLGTRYSKLKTGSKEIAINHVDLISDEWNVELKSLSSTKENFEKLKEVGGQHITHIVKIQKANEKLFSGKEAQDCLSALRLFLSFAKGGWSEPICAIGFDVTSNRIWELWSSPKESWDIPITWFDPHNSSQLIKLFPAFMNKWGNDYWREALNEIIYWYLNANNTSQGTDAGIILTQTAIERLSYEFVVNERQLISSNGFKNLWASDKLRILFSSLRIPIDIPKETSKIESLAKEFKWQDAPHALTEIRNSLVHPEHKSHGKFESVYYEAWNLGLWYLEMGILASCNYNETYSNRLKFRWIGQVENVPWISA